MIAEPAILALVLGGLATLAYRDHSSFRSIARIIYVILMAVIIACLGGVISYAITFSDVSPFIPPDKLDHASAAIKAGIGATIYRVMFYCIGAFLVIGILERLPDMGIKPPENGDREKR